MDHAESARKLIGTRFRPQGRGEQGLDCIGVVMATFDIPAGSVPRDYRLRGSRGAELVEGLGKFFRRVLQLKAGDVMLMKVSNDQLHLAVRTEHGFVHAHAGVGRVVETPGMPEWPLAGIYRKRRKS